MSPPQPLPLATLRLSHPLLLDAVLSADGTPLYSFETALNQTSLLRCIPDSDSLEQVASVQWPLHSVPTTPRRKERETGVFVKMADGPSLPELDFLRVHTGVMHSSRKFNIPGLDRSLKWRRAGSAGVWECTSPSSSTPIATFEPANLTSPAKIKLYIAGLSPPNKRNYRTTKICGVCTTLMDYVVLTTMLLLTDKDGWKMLAATTPATHSGGMSVTSSSPTSSSPVSPISPITPFSANQSPCVSSYDAYSGWCRSAAGGTGTCISVGGSSCYASSSTTGTGITIRSTSSQSQNRNRPRTSPSSSTLASLASAPSTSAAPTYQRSMRRSTSQYVRPGSQWSRASPLPSRSQSSFDDDDFEESPVLDIRPSHSHSHSQPQQQRSQTLSHSRSQSYSSAGSPTPSPSRTPTRGTLRVQVPSTPIHTSGVPPPPATASVQFSRAYPYMTTENLPFLKTDPAELPPPPPYEEIDWRVKAPRRTRSTVFH